LLLGRLRSLHGIRISQGKTVILWEPLPYYEMSSSSNLLRLRR
jgi:hypothetical protein